ncbi:MAG: hypothetical protein JWP06_141 [Candidatus Saccharibacteria bacterium]|nr:hypothetical protein [Candidatus Saccharibacteria bacterium]
MSQIISGEQMTLTVGAIVNFFKENISGVLLLVGFIIGFSIVAALFDDWNEERNFKKRYHL